MILTFAESLIHQIYIFEYLIQLQLLKNNSTLVITSKIVIIRLTIGFLRNFGMLLLMVEFCLFEIVGIFACTNIQLRNNFFSFPIILLLINITIKINASVRSVINRKYLM